MPTREVLLSFRPSLLRYSAMLTVPPLLPVTVPAATNSMLWYVSQQASGRLAACPMAIFQRREPSSASREASGSASNRWNSPAASSWESTLIGYQPTSPSCVNQPLPISRKSWRSPSPASTSAPRNQYWGEAVMPTALE